MNIFRRAMLTLRGVALYPYASYGAWSSGLSARRGLNEPLTEPQRLQLAFGWVRAASLRIAEDISMLAVTVETKRGNVWEAAPDHPLQALIASPGISDGMSFRNLSQQHINLLGRMAWLVVEDDRGLPLELHALYPYLLTPIPDPINYISKWQYRSFSGQMQYYAPFRGKKSGAATEVLELHIPDPSNPYASNSTVQAASNNIMLDGEIRSFAKFFFQNNASIGVVNESEQPYPGEGKAQELKRAFNENFQGVTNAGKAAWLWNGAKMRPLAPKFSEFEYPALSRATRNDILGHFGVPASLFGITDTGQLGGNAAEVERRNYQAHTLDPHRIRLEHAYNMLARRYGDNVRVRIESPVEEDVAKQREQWQWDYAHGALGRDRYRELIGEQPDGQPDIFTFPANSVVMEKLEAYSPSGGIVLDTDVPKRQSAYRAQFASEYARLKNGDLKTLEPVFEAEWQELLPERVREVSGLRRWALEKGGPVNRYELLKSTGAKRLARQNGTEKPN